MRNRATIRHRADRARIVRGSCADRAGADYAIEQRALIAIQASPYNFKIVNHFLRSIIVLFDIERFLSAARKQLSRDNIADKGCSDTMLTYDVGFPLSKQNM